MRKVEDEKEGGGGKRSEQPIQTPVDGSGTGEKRAARQPLRGTQDGAGRCSRAEDGAGFCGYEAQQQLGGGPGLGARRRGARNQRRRCPPPLGQDPAQPPADFPPCFPSARRPNTPTGVPPRVRGNPDGKCATPAAQRGVRASGSAEASPSSPDWFDRFLLDPPSPSSRVPIAPLWPVPCSGGAAVLAAVCPLTHPHVSVQR
ncbi:unnamed protein product [Pleuronectes platessa]|uniref:Uncharacterized protein n=1 Tax=Pleuronectes platessa TaxID=8262 RepID=A0A9N7UXZ9_PLEPL|nr:unnamed protein product [Pleuronectes platessa]